MSKREEGSSSTSEVDVPDDQHLQNPVHGENEITLDDTGTSSSVKSVKEADQPQAQMRRSGRDKRPSLKAKENLDKSIQINRFKFQGAYLKWKQEAKVIRTKLKGLIHKEECIVLTTLIKQCQASIITRYEEMCKLRTPTSEEVQRTDRVQTVTADILGLLLKASETAQEDFDPVLSLFHTRAILDKMINPSVFGTSVTESYVSQESEVSWHSHASEVSKTSSRSNAASELAADVALKRAQLQSLHSLHAQERRIKEEEDKLALLRAQAEVDAAVARSESFGKPEGTYHTPCGSMGPVQRQEEAPMQPQSQSFVDSVQATVREVSNPISSSNPTRPPGCKVSPDSPDVTIMMQAFQESVSFGRLPVPEPPVFRGDPLFFPEWKNAFTKLIERRTLGATDKLFYLRKYTAGPAAKAIQGTFLRSDEAAYQDAWSKLNSRYGDPFLIQRAFRDKIAKWPKVGERDSKGLQDLSDFLSSCNDAIPHVKGLGILNDCEENRKMVSKLPEWVSRRWNRRVAAALKYQSYPSFGEFCHFLLEEAEVVCNPFTSPTATTYTEPVERDSKQGKRKVFSTKSKQASAPTAPQPATSESSSSFPSCYFCSEEHSIHKCNKFGALSTNERVEFVKKNWLCFRCMRKGHKSSECKRPATCGKCQKRHPTLLHVDQPDFSTTATTNQPVQTTTTNQSAQASSSIASTETRRTLCNASKQEATSLVVPVWVTTGNASQEVLTYAMLDTQSDSSYMLRSISDALGAQGPLVRLKLATMTSTSEVSDCMKLSGVSIRGFQDLKSIPMTSVYIRDFIPADESLITTPESTQNWPHLQSIVDQIPPLQDCDIGLLIGFDCTTALIPREVLAGQDDQPFAIRTDLGWSIVGGEAFPKGDSVCHKVRCREGPVVPKDVLTILERDFIDEPGGKVSQEDLQFLQTMGSSTSQQESGNLIMPLPFRSRPQLPLNRSQASARMAQLKRRFVKDDRYHRDYTKFMQEIISQEEAEEVTGPGEENEVWYIPHHGVYHPRKPDKIRVVFDCSSRHKGTSLNDHLLTGPDLTNSLVGVLCRFRKHPIAVACDIERMFHQFIVQPNDRDFLRFLWWPDGDIDSDPVEYRMKVHLFGAASSPGCANYGLKYLADQYKETLPVAASFIRDQFYVDDGLASLETPEQVIHLVKESRLLCSKGGLHLHKFMSNNREVLESIPAEERATAVRNVDLSKEVLPVSSTLGIQWDVEKDEFFFVSQMKDFALTRRGILSMVSSVYDPLGFLAPFILPGKIVLQHMCKSGTSWDDPLPKELEPRWNQWVADFEMITSLRIPRCLIPSRFTELKSVELHHFSDASCTGYGQCSYLRILNNNNEVHCSLLMAKARVAPSKIATIPRLELAAAVVSVKVSRILGLELNIQDAKEIFWTDSQVVLGYICNEARRFHTFVANRVQLIREHTSPDQWCYVDTYGNPSDMASRGVSASNLLQSDWYKGPKFLWDPELAPAPWNSSSLSLEDPEVRQVKVFTVSSKSISLWLKLTKFSSWKRLVCAIARLRRRAKGMRHSQKASVEERRAASAFIMQLVQREDLKEDTASLKNLNPFTDTDGMIRVGGRLQKSSLSWEEVHPVILPGNNHVTSLIIDDCHQDVKHQGRGITLNELRSRGLWVIGASTRVSSHLHKCVTCRRSRRPAEQQKMADLPVDRVEPSPPFMFCGMDCLGPFTIKLGRKEVKRYGLLFTCMCSRAIHVELLDDLTTDAFINGLRCFIAIRGKVCQIGCDQGTNFMGAGNEFKAALKELDAEGIKAYLANQDCEFLFNPPHASHAGGVWERQIRTFRSVLGKTLDLCPGRLDDSSLRTLFYEAMAIVNSRPLTCQSLHDPQLMPLTPNHILTMKSSIALPPPGKFLPQDMYLRKRWRRVQYLVEQFWSRWRNEYLQNLNRRCHWTKERRNVEEGDVVLLSEPDAPRNGWPLGLVVEATNSTDDLVRKVKVKIFRQGKHSVLERPVQKLVVLVETKTQSAKSAAPGPAEE